MEKRFIEELKKQDLEFGKEVERLSGYIMSRANKLVYFCSNNFEDFDDFVQDFFLGMLITRKRNKERGIKGNYYMASLMGTYKNKIDKLIRDNKFVFEQLDVGKCVAKIDLDLYLYSKIGDILDKLDEKERKFAMVILGLDEGFLSYMQQRQSTELKSGGKKKCFRVNRKSYVCEYLGIPVKDYELYIYKLKDVLKSII